VMEHEKRSASLKLSGERDRPIPAGALVLGATAGVLLGTSAVLWAFGGTSNGTMFGAPLSRTGDMNAQNRTHDDFMAAAAVTLGAAVTTLVTALVVYATRPFRTPKRPN
jgi:hypothetical protein